MRQLIYKTIEADDDRNVASQVYDFAMLVSIIISLIPLATKSEALIFNIIDKITVVIFILDYCLRLFTADLKLNKGLASFVLYPFTFMAIVDLLAIFPSLVQVNAGLKIFKVFRLGKTLKAFKVLKIFKVARYSKNIQLIVNVLRKQKSSLTVVCCLAIAYTLISALIVFNVEPETFATFFDAVYWAVVSLTTVGYGDIYCVTTIGKIITMVSALFGIAIVALPAGIITAGYMDEISNQKED